MTSTVRKRGTAPRQSTARAITENGINIVYRNLRDSVKVEYPDGPLPQLDGAASILPRRKKVTGGGVLPHPADVRMVIERALTSLVNERSKLPEFRYLRLALRRHVELGLSLNQAFGYDKTGRGAPPALDEERAQRIACAVFEERFIKGRKAEVAGHQAGKRFGVKKTKALEVFTSHRGYALHFFKLKRIESNRSPLWTKAEEQRLIAYYTPGERKSARSGS